MLQKYTEEQNVRIRRSVVRSVQTHETFLGLCNRNKAKQRNRNEEEQGNVTVACRRKHGVVSNYEKHSFISKLNTFYYDYINIKGKYILRVSFLNYSLVSISYGDLY
jgi:hypothetical protein